MQLFWDIKNVVFSLLNKTTIGTRTLIIKNNQILLVKHTYMPGWYIPGGAVDCGEITLEAAKREAFEETGITLLELELVGVYYNTAQKRNDYVIFYICKDFVEGEMKPNSEIAEQKWFAIDKLPPDISESTKRRIDEYLGKRAIDGKW
jgi:ADP-ribose pyrophosphatase YjhB (NUDIX family)